MRAELRGIFGDDVFDDLQARSDKWLPAHEGLHTIVADEYASPREREAVGAKFIEHVRDINSR
jgi:hypothetical protein